MEKWRDIPGYEKLYQASDCGNIRTCEGKTTENARFNRRVWKQRVLKQKITRNKKGRLDARVSLWKDGKEKTCLVSRLVAMSWVEGYAQGLTVNHSDGNTLNNTASNLEWVTLADNIRHGFNNGPYRTGKHIKLESAGIVYEFDSYSAADKFIGRKCGYVSNCINKNKAINSVYKVQFTFVE